ASWNGLAISGLAEAGRVFGRKDLVDAAVGAARFVLTGLRSPEGRLQRSWRADRTSGPAFLDDHAMMAGAALDLYETTFDEDWFSHATRLVDEAIRLFADPASRRQKRRERWPTSSGAATSRTAFWRWAARAARRCRCSPTGRSGTERPRGTSANGSSARPRPPPRRRWRPSWPDRTGWFVTFFPGERAGEFLLPQKVLRVGWDPGAAWRTVRSSHTCSGEPRSAPVPRSSITTPPSPIRPPSKTCSAPPLWPAAPLPSTRPS